MYASTTPLDCEEAEIELTVATISNYNQGCLLLFLDSGFAATAPHGDANRITADSSGALHSNLLERRRKKKKPASCTSSPLCSLRCCSSRKPKALLSHALLQEQIKIRRLLTVSRPVGVAAPAPEIPPPAAARLAPSGAKSIGRLVRLTWSRGQKLL